MAKAPNNEAPAVTGGRLHKATYSTDRKKGGYLIRIEGPNAAEFGPKKTDQIGVDNKPIYKFREVPVTTKDGAEHRETLTRLIWSGNDQESGKPVALYTFQAKARDDMNDDIPF